MTSNNIADYLQVGLAADQEADPTDPAGLNINPEILMFRYNTDTGVLVVFDPAAEAYVGFLASGAGADLISFDNAASGLAATDVQAAIDELDAAVDALGAPFTAEEARDTIATFIQNGTGITWNHVDGSDTLTPTVTITQYTDELAQDAVGGMVDASLTYVDATPLLQRAALTGDVTAAAGSNATALAANTVNHSELALSWASVKKSVDQTAANYSTGAVVAFDAEISDADGWHDNVSNNSFLTVIAGVTLVEVMANVQLNSVTADNFALIQLRKNGTASFDGAIGQFGEVGATSIVLSFHSQPIACVAGDDFELELTCQDSSITVEAARTSFSIKAIG